VEKLEKNSKICQINSFFS